MFGQDIRVSASERQRELGAQALRRESAPAACRANWERKPCSDVDFYGEYDIIYLFLVRLKNGKGDDVLLSIQNISKEYVTGDLVQTALDDVSLNFRDNEFVAILGPSGSGKTTLLNVVGGLDRYDSGDLIINGISTKKYRDRDWDSYRNHTIGFVFQSYNLIPHQSVLANVELALTISGVSRSERKKRAKEALEKVGLGDQLHKRPNQMSGGQMQRVAIARALVNDPDILLADEPTGALDSETSVQVMELLNEVANDRLVIMVTHNPELAEKYATRIVKLSDGKIIDDSDPYVLKKDEQPAPEHKRMGKASMSFGTSLSLSFNNLRTKKGRTILTSFAGSIGIIGIALIQSLSSGVNAYIDSIQKDTMSSYPITIDAETVDFSSFMSVDDSDDEDVDHDKDAVYSKSKSIQAIVDMSSSVTENNLTAFKKYLDDDKSDIHKYVGDNGIVYSYDTDFSVYTYDDNDYLVNADGSTLLDEATSKTQLGLMASYSRSMTSISPSSMVRTETNVFEQLIPGTDGKSVSNAVYESYDVVYGTMPDAYDEMVLVLDDNNEVTLYDMYELGLLTTEDFRELAKKIDENEKFTIDSYKLDYKTVCDKTYYLMPACDYYEKQSDGTYINISDDSAKLEKKLDDCVKLKITGIIRPKENSDSRLINSSVGYTKKLTDYLIEHAEESEIVKEQKKNKNINVITGLSFTAKSDDEKAEDAEKYISSLSTEEKSEVFSAYFKSAIESDPQLLQKLQNNAAMSMPQSGSEMPSGIEPGAIPDTSSAVPEQSVQPSAPDAAAIQGSYPQQMQGYPDMASMSAEEMEAMFEQFLASDEEYVKTMLVGVYDKYISSGSYDENMTAFGVISVDAPSSIAIYADSFEDKEKISECIEAYNKKAKEEDKISYVDYVALLMSSVTTIVNVISYVLMAFVAVSLIVSSIMIGIITYISVLERTKEIGILRAIGASKRNISRVFNAETFIIGLFSGCLGIGITLLLLIPINWIIHMIAESDVVNAMLPWNNAVTLIVLSVILTLIGGIIPSRKAAKKDPVAALRTE